MAAERAAEPVIEVVDPRDPAIGTLLAALTVELAGGGYSPSETFGYSVDQLEASGVRLLGARFGDDVVGVAGIELQPDGVAELKRFYVRPEHRGSGVADALVDRLVGHARLHERHTVRLETGDKQHAAMRLYARHGFVRVDRFAPYLDSATSVCMALTL